MSKETKRVRWNCPNGCPGILASTRPPKDSIERYCLVCSAKTGRLVLRIAPALENKRTAAAASAAAKAKRQRASAAVKRARAKAAHEAKHVVDGVDLRVEMKRLIKLRAFGGRTGRLAQRPPTLEVRPRTSHPRSRLGCADGWSNHIIVNTYPGCDIADLRETLIHELTHIAVGVGQGHNERFRLTLAKAVREAYDVIAKGAGHNVYHGRYAAALRAKGKEA